MCYSATVRKQTSAKDNVHKSNNLINYSSKFGLKYEGAPVESGTGKMFYLEDGHLADIPGRPHQIQELHLQLL